MSQNESDDSESRYPRPPLEFTDYDERRIEIRGGCPRDVLVEMYEDYAPECRAQGLPPVGEQRINEWLDVLEEGMNVVAFHVAGETTDEPPSENRREVAVGHACLLDCGDGRAELTIFVHQDYQLAGIGSRLIRVLLGHGQSLGVEEVWLTVERSNHVAMNLYRSVGFETSNAAGIEHEMELTL